MKRSTETTLGQPQRARGGGPRRAGVACAVCLLVIAFGQAAAQTTRPDKTDAPEPGGQGLAAARQYVEASDRYLHHSRLERGMKGFGLTVMSGTKIARFDVEIVSVVTNWGPHQDVILARLSGKDVDGVDLQKTGMIAGTSGSPVYVRHEGKDRLIGAVSSGWFAQQPQEPLCGIQPITQMLATSGLVPVPGGSEAGTTQRGPSGSPSSLIAGAGPGRPGLVERREFLDAVLDPRKSDFLWLALPPDRGPTARDGLPRLTPLATPVMISGLGRPGGTGKTLGDCMDVLHRMGMMPVSSGGAGPAGMAELRETPLEPGSALAIPLVRGDADWSAIGTVTEVRDGLVLAMGHGFTGDGDVEFPFGPAYVHTVVGTMLNSFKLASGGPVAGTLRRDEAVGVSGVLGAGPKMIPMAVEVVWSPPAGQANGRPAGQIARTQRYRYEVVRHRVLTPGVARMLLAEVTAGWSNLPELHTLTYSVVIDFGAAGRYRAENVSSNDLALSLISDTVRPLAAMLNNPLGDPPAIESIDIRLEVEPVARRATVLDLRLDGAVYRPGETVTGAVTIQEFRQARRDVPVRFDLPDDLPDGAYTLRASDFADATRQLRAEMPQRFDPRSVPELLQTMQRVVEPATTKLYLRLPLQDSAGLALEKREMPDLPASKAAVLGEAARLDGLTFRRAVVREVEVGCVLDGSAAAGFTVQYTPTQTLVRPPAWPAGREELPK